MAYIFVKKLKLVTVTNNAPFVVKFLIYRGLRTITVVVCSSDPSLSVKQTMQESGWVWTCLIELEKFENVQIKLLQAHA